MPNVTRLIKQNAGKAAPQFIEGQVFRMKLPVAEVKTARLNAGLNEGLNEGLKSLLQVIAKKPGLKAKEVSEKLGNRPIKTVERQIKTLVEKGLIERRWSKKTGGYFLNSNHIESLSRARG